MLFIYGYMLNNYEILVNFRLLLYKEVNWELLKIIEPVYGTRDYLEHNLFSQLFPRNFINVILMAQWERERERYWSFENFSAAHHYILSKRWHRLCNTGSHNLAITSALILLCLSNKYLLEIYLSRSEFISDFITCYLLFQCSASVMQRRYVNQHLTLDSKLADIKQTKTSNMN